MSGLSLSSDMGLGLVPRGGGVSVPANALAQADGALITLDDGTQITVE